MAFAQAISDTKPLSYHDQLYEMCDGKAGMKCCRASVRSMRDEQARLVPEKGSCPEGTHRMSLSCPSSFTWCSYKTVEEVRGGDARGDSFR